jgi:hypothetical protein
MNAGNLTQARSAARRFADTLQSAYGLAAIGFQYAPELAAT